MYVGNTMFEHMLHIWKLNCTFKDNPYRVKLENMKILTTSNILQVKT